MQPTRTSSRTAFITATTYEADGQTRRIDDANGVWATFEYSPTRRWLTRIVTTRPVYPKIGYPKTIRVDQGSEFVSRDFDLWAYAKGLTLNFSRPGKPTDNTYIEAFNGRFRAECLNAHWFLTLADAAEKMEDWRRYYNEVRPHGAIGHKVPISLLSHGCATSPPS